MSLATRDAALAAAAAHFDSGAFAHGLAQRVAVRTESQNPASGPALHAYLQDHIGPALAALGFTCQVHDNPAPALGADAPAPGPFLTARRHESVDLPTVLMYGHGDVIRGQDASWRKGQGPWVLATVGDKL